MSSQDEQIQRLHYFNNQFLKAEDFTTEQEYHLEMRRRHNRVLHTKGVAEGLEIKKTNNKEITVKVGTAIDGDGNEIILLQDLPISLADTTKYPNNSTVYVFASYEEKREKPQPENSTDENQTTRFFENPVIKAETEEPDANKKEIVRLGRFQLDGNGNVPNEDNFLNSGFREEATAKLPTFSISIEQLKTELKANKSEKVIYGTPSKILVFETPISSSSSEKQNIGAFILVYAFSADKDAKFSWTQEYETKPDEEKDLLVQKQYVVFNNQTRPDPNQAGIDITITYKIYAVLPN